MKCPKFEVNSLVVAPPPLLDYNIETPNVKTHESAIARVVFDNNEIDITSLDRDPNYV